MDLIGGGCYILIIVDNFSKYYHVEILKAKSEAAKAVEFFVTKMETQHLRNLKRPRSDNGGESIARIYRAGLMSKVQYTKPHTVYTRIRRCCRACGTSSERRRESPSITSESETALLGISSEGSCLCKEQDHHNDER